LFLLPILTTTLPKSYPFLALAIPTRMAVFGAHGHNVAVLECLHKPIDLYSVNPVLGPLSNT